MLTTLELKQENQHRLTNLQSKSSSSTLRFRKLPSSFLFLNRCRTPSLTKIAPATTDLSSILPSIPENRSVSSSLWKCRAKTRHTPSLLHELASYSSLLHMFSSSKFTIFDSNFRNCRVIYDAWILVMLYRLVLYRNTVVLFYRLVLCRELVWHGVLLLLIICVLIVILESHWMLYLI
ncbi:unnamed protein product [Vicia faba]|uniref:Uncharacterized protein n=1 Tax=Vicia faba TaxID=3906 RepID=A0AAV1AXL2_VICFA|nr:unnamed protein product [Vicia faba]